MINDNSSMNSAKIAARFAVVENTLLVPVPVPGVAARADSMTKLSPPDFEVFDSKRIYRQMAGVFYKMLPLEFSRGCIYNCAYCSAPAFATLFGGVGKWFRIKDLDQIFREIDLMIEKFQVEYFYIVSETFLAMPRNIFDEFVKRYQKIRIPFWFNTRPETINEEEIGRASCRERV